MVDSETCATAGRSIVDWLDGKLGGEFADGWAPAMAASMADDSSRVGRACGRYVCSPGFYMHGEAQAGIFFTSGAAVLALLLGEIRHWLRARGGRSHKLFSLVRLSALNTARNPGRSTLTIGLVAAASFLIVAVSAFRLDTGEEGTGGFEFVATSDQPIHYDLNTADGRRELGFSDRGQPSSLENWRVLFAARCGW